MGLGTNGGPLAPKEKNTAQVRLSLHKKGGSVDPHEAISGFPVILSYFRFYFLEELGGNRLVLEYGELFVQSLRGHEDEDIMLIQGA